MIAFKSWQELKQRLGHGRRFYAYTHPNMPGEPLVFVHVALTQGLANNIQAILDQDTNLPPAEGEKVAAQHCSMHRLHA